MTISKPTRHGWFSGLSADLLAQSLLRRFLTILALALLVPGSVIAQSPEAAAQPESTAYRLGAGDVIIVTVHNHDDLSGTFQLDGTGTISMSLIGTIDAAGVTAAQLERRIVSRLKPDYLVNPRVTVRVQNYRPYYLIGEVSSTGAFNYVQGMTYLTAIAIAGGYTYRAKKGIVFVIRGDDPEREEMEMDVDEKVQPGDIIRVAERLF
jgi:polysaccharide export outer membrane protein